jgi:NAD(P)-dependent dehydrogenase (short-subunit alcohol dehydrogenase family)
MLIQYIRIPLIAVHRSRLLTPLIQGQEQRQGLRQPGEPPPADRSYPQDSPLIFNMVPLVPVRQIVNTTSISGVMKRASGGQFAYAASKAATFQMTKVLATELMETGIRCNQIAPGRPSPSPRSSISNA